MIANAAAGMGTSLLSIGCQAATDNAILNGRIYFGEDASISASPKIKSVGRLLPLIRISWDLSSSEMTRK